jgi:hypothetical protein
MIEDLIFKISKIIYKKLYKEINKLKENEKIEIEN